MSVLWSLRKFVDSIQTRKEEAAQERAQQVPHRFSSSPGDDEDVVEAGTDASLSRQCRICGYQSAEITFCPDCLADTMQDPE
jgi:hypothetical protein